MLWGIDDVDKVTWFRQVSADRTHRTRATEGGQNIARESSKAELRRNFFSQRVAEKWNELPLHVKNAPSTTVFKASLKSAKHMKTPLTFNNNIQYIVPGGARDFTKPH